MTVKAASFAPHLATEAPVELIYNGHAAVTFMCTPREVSALALGWLFSQGLIRGADEVYTIGACEDLRKVYVQTAVDRWEERCGWERVVTSGCGGGTMLATQLAGEVPRVGAGPRVTPGELAQGFREMAARSALYRVSGGLHSAALVGGGRLLIHSEDIGRHNAVDKVIGQGLLQRVDFSRALLLTTGRISCEMVFKAAQAGVPVLASLTTATDLACELARRAGITLVGRAAGRRLAVYAGRERVKGWPAPWAEGKGSEASRAGEAY